MPSMSEPVELVNTVDLLARGIINMSENKKSISILLVGEARKTSMLTLLVNVLAGHAPAEYDLKLYDTKNETGGTGSESQTNPAKVYEFYSVNGVKITVLDTPGLANTRKGKEHRDRIAAALWDNIPEVTAVIILANGATRRLGISTDYAIPTLTSILPRSLANNICLLCTNIPIPLSCNFKTDALPAELQHSKQFLLDNPIDVAKNYLTVDNHEREENLEDARQAIFTSHQAALNVLVKMFNWMDTLESKNTAEITSLYDLSIEIERNIAGILHRMTRLVDRRRYLQTLISESNSIKLNIRAFESSQKPLDLGAQRLRGQATMLLEEEELLISNVQHDINDTTTDITESIMLIGVLAEKYSELSLSGRFPVQVRKSVKVLQVHLESIRDESDPESIRQIEASLERLKAQLDSLERAAIAARKTSVRTLDDIGQKTNIMNEAY